MEEVIHYLELKNRFYEKFFQTTEKFLTNVSGDEWNDVPFYVDTRERILNIIRSFDHKIALAFERVDWSTHSPEVYQERVKTILDTRGNWISKIVRLDLEIMQRLDDVKTETIRDLKRTVEKQQQVQTFEDNAAPKFRKTFKAV